MQKYDGPGGEAPAEAGEIVAGRQQPSNNIVEPAEQAPSWRDLFEVHPAADLFPMLGEAELGELAEDIEKNGLRQPAAAVRGAGSDRPVLLDGRNRLEALWRLDPGRFPEEPSKLLARHDLVQFYPSAVDPVGFIISANVRRRHLTAEQRREIIARLLKADPSRSDRETAKIAAVDHKTVAAVRAQAEARGEIPHADRRTDTKGRRQPARKVGDYGRIISRDQPQKLRAEAPHESPALERDKAIVAVAGLLNRRLRPALEDLTKLIEEAAPRISKLPKAVRRDLAQRLFKAVFHGDDE